MQVWWVVIEKHSNQNQRLRLSHDLQFMFGKYLKLSFWMSQMSDLCKNRDALRCLSSMPHHNFKKWPHWKTLAHPALTTFIPSFSLLPAESINPSHSHSSLIFFTSQSSRSLLALSTPSSKKPAARALRIPWEFLPLGRPVTVPPAWPLP